MNSKSSTPTENLNREQRQLAACDKLARGTTRVNYPGSNPYYRRLQDNSQKMVFFKFFTKPDADILAVLKSEELSLRGLQQVESDTYGQIWLLPLTKEGLTTADTVDFKLRKIFDEKRIADRSK